MSEDNLNIQEISELVRASFKEGERCAFFLSDAKKAYQMAECKYGLAMQLSRRLDQALCKYSYGIERYSEAELLNAEHMAASWEDKPEALIVASEIISELREIMRTPAST